MHEDFATASANQLLSPAPNPTAPSTGDHKLDVAIIGGGICGLVTALALHIHAPHISFTVYEAREAFGVEGAGVNFSSNAAHALGLISPELLEAFLRISTSNTDPCVWFDIRCGMDAPCGSGRGLVMDEHVVSVRDDGDRPRGGIRRAEFLDELKRLLPSDTGVFGKKLDAVEELNGGDVLLRFKDGTTARHSAVLGCDGIKAKTREILLGIDDPATNAIFSGQYTYRAILPMKTAVEKLGDQQARNAHIYLGYNQHIVTYPISQGTTMHVSAVRDTDTWESSSFDSSTWIKPCTRSELEEEFRGFSAPLREVMALVSKPEKWALFHHEVPVHTYCRGRLALMGDAAHASTPAQGAGGGMAVEDAYIMAVLLGRVSRRATEGAQGLKVRKHLESAFVAFDAARRDRTQKVVRTSAEAGKLYSCRLDGVGDDMARIREEMLGRLKWIWEYDIERAGVEAVEMFEQMIAD